MSTNVIGSNAKFVGCCMCGKPIAEDEKVLEKLDYMDGFDDKTVARCPHCNSVLRITLTISEEYEYSTHRATDKEIESLEKFEERVQDVDGQIFFEFAKEEKSDESV